ncbi:hypothetical protein V8C43DRAFT_323961 [Trichoderma afarasin]
MAEPVQSGGPPSEEEARLYYYGLPSRPRLIARSGTRMWVNPQMPGFTTFLGTQNMYPRVLQPVGRHPQLHQQWNDGSSSLRAEILKAVDGINWTALDILRVGLNGEYTLTLMIAVLPDSLSWSDGHPIALQCKGIFESHGIQGVECEIRESIVNLCTNAGLEPAISASESPDISDTGIPQLQLSSEPIPEGHLFANELMEMSDRLGTRIATMDNLSRAGTKGLYLRVDPSSAAGEPRLLALTCRHVVIIPATEGIQEYDSRESNDQSNSRKPDVPRDVIQSDQPTFEAKISSLGEGAQSARESARQYAKTKELAARFEACRNSCLSVQQTMKLYESPSSRVFGQVLFAPALAVTSDSARGTGWLRDWALIELSPKSHQSSFLSIKNKVYLEGQCEFKNLVDRSKGRLLGRAIPTLVSIVDGCIELEKTEVSVDEILDPEVSKYFDEPAMVVAKYGPSSGLTLGVGSTLVSLVRYSIDIPDGTEKAISEEWPIVPTEKNNWHPQAPFSTKGDSGSCVWDLRRRPAGILTSGASAKEFNDVTYAQPLERLLKDIRSCGFEVSLL